MINYKWHLCAIVIILASCNQGTNEAISIIMEIASLHFVSFAMTKGFSTASLRGRNLHNDEIASLHFVSFAMMAYCLLVIRHTYNAFFCHFEEREIYSVSILNRRFLLRRNDKTYNRL